MTTLRNVLPRSYARTAGLLYLLMAVVSGFAIAYVPSTVLVAGDASATAVSTHANSGLLAFGTLGEAVVMLLEIVISVMFFVLFRPASLTLSLIAMVSRLMMVGVMACNLLIHIVPRVLLGDASYLGVFPPEQLQATAMLVLKVHQLGGNVWNLFFGFNLAVMGSLVVRSGFVPRLVGFGLALGGAGYLLQGLLKSTLIDSPSLDPVVVALIAVASLAELALALWLVFRGARTPTLAHTAPLSMAA